MIATNLYQAAIVVDDIAADRQLAMRPLRKAGWAVHPARNSIEAIQTTRIVLGQTAALATVLLIDLNMPADPLYGRTNHRRIAGAQLALHLRAQMEQGNLARVPIIAITALSRHEIHTTALAFGCDAVLTKPATPDLADRIHKAIAQAQTTPGELAGTTALLQLLRFHLAESLVSQPGEQIPLTEQDVTRALLAYHRQGLNGLGRSALAAFLAPHEPSILSRGEAAYAALVQICRQMTQRGVLDTATILQGELERQLKPAEQSASLGMSLSEYYRRRREALTALFELIITGQTDPG